MTPAAPGSRPPRSLIPLGLLALGSGFCALAYQTAWFRMFRQVFGASTGASSAVLAVFMGGLGLGSWFLGRRADRVRSPLVLYAGLEAGIAAGAALSPLLLHVVDRLYITAGGSQALGSFLALAARLGLTACVLAAPTFLMGGTLPALARAAEASGDVGRRRLGGVYGYNTLGALLGVLLPTFFGFEVLGVRASLWIASLLNLLVAVAARALARRRPAAAQPASPQAAQGRDAAAPVAFVLGAAAAVGFVFFLMELVWYRMLGPLLGGSSFTFGLILATALLGIGLGGLAYAAGAANVRPTLPGFAALCALEAVCVAVPFALGDRIAILALLLRGLGAAGFWWLAGSWLLVTLVVVLPAALVAGYQFPYLVGLLGTGEARVGRQVGLAYAWNTLGAIAGALAGGFGLLPWLGATGAWRGAGVGLGVLAVCAAGLGPRPRQAAPALALAALAGGLAAAPGPSAAWRHSPIGAGRMEGSFADPNALARSLAERRRNVVWERDGVESSVALGRVNGYTLLVSGKSDGNCRRDAPTQVMGGLLGAILHPAPRRSLVIGLGTGSSAGWLARVEGMERVDVVELEPAVLRVAEACRAVNQGVLEDPRVRVLVGDGREWLRASRERYDVIFSEPSNPYRAGVASLFTREFYGSVAERLGTDGIFLQWLQAYEVDAPTVRIAVGTLASVFPVVEVWEVQTGADLVLLGSRVPVVHDAGRVRERLRDPALRTALALAWGVEDVEGFYGAYVAGPGFARRVRSLEAGWINTDDRPVLEYGFARNLGLRGGFDTARLRQVASDLGYAGPQVLGPVLDWARVAEGLMARAVYEGGAAYETLFAARLEGPVRERSEARRAYREGRLRDALEAWRRQGGEPTFHLDRLLVAEGLAEAGEEPPEALLDSIAALSPVAAEAIRSRALLARGDVAAGGERLLAALRAYREDPWAYPPLIGRSLDRAVEVGRADGRRGRQLFEVLGAPHALEMLWEERMRARWVLAKEIDFAGLCEAALGPLEPHVPVDHELLRNRLRCYEERRSPLAGQARQDLELYEARVPGAL